MTAALAMAAALGIDVRAAAELLPVLEAVMVRRLNDACAAVQDGSFLEAET
jgi:hypothetical protein